MYHRVNGHRERRDTAQSEIVPPTYSGKEVEVRQMAGGIAYAAGKAVGKATIMVADGNDPSHWYFTY